MELGISLSSFLSSLSSFFHSPQPFFLLVRRKTNGGGPIHRKTQLAVEYCHLLREEQPEVRIFWFTASSLNKLESQYKVLGQLLDSYSQSSSAMVTIKNIVRMYSQPGNEVGLVKAWIASHPSWVLVMDNFDNISFDVDQFIPSTGSGQVLFTSRNKRLTMGPGASHSLRLVEPECAEGAFLFLRLRSEEDITFSEVERHSEYPQIREIVQNLHGFPLALSQAAAYIRANDPFSYAEYLELLTAREEEDREFLLKYMPENAGYPSSVMTTWEISLDYLQRTDPDSAKLLQLLGFFAPSDIPIDILRRATERTKWCFGSHEGYRSLTFEQCRELKFLAHKARLYDQLGLLLSLSLISKDVSKHFSGNSSLPGSGVLISVHPLVHEWIQFRLKPQPKEAARFANLCALMLYQIYPLNQYAGFIESSSPARIESEVKTYRLQPHLIEVFHNVSKYAEFAWPPALELRTLLLATLLGDLSEPWYNYSGESELVARLEASKGFCSSFWVSETDDLASFQATTFKTINGLQAKSDLQAWVKLTRELQAWLAHPKKIVGWTPAIAIHVTIMISLTVAILDRDLDGARSFSFSAKYGVAVPSLSGNRETPSKVWDIKVKERICTVLLSALSFLKLQDDTAPDEIYFLIGIIKCRLGNVFSKDQYSNLPQQFFTQDLYPKIFKHMGTYSAASYFIHLFRLHTANQFEVHIFTQIISRYTEIFIKWTSMEGARFIHEHKYISSGGGRSGTMSPVIHSSMNSPLRSTMEEYGAPSAGPQL